MGLLIVAYEPWREAVHYTGLMTVVIKAHCRPRSRGTRDWIVLKLPTGWG